MSCHAGVDLSVGDINPDAEDPGEDAAAIRHGVECRFGQICEV